jgi:hypothetical protein
MEPTANPFAVLSLIVAPAILTNASTALVMSTGNRLARAVDRARNLAKELEQDSSSPQSPRRLRELADTEQRAVMLLSVLRCFYTAMGSFAFATFIALVGAVVANLVPVWMLRSVAGAAVAVALVAVGAIVYGSVILMRETRIAVDILTQRAAEAREQYSQWEQSQQESSIQA